MTQDHSLRKSWSILLRLWGKILMKNTHRSRGSGKGKESEYENGESDCPDDEEVTFCFIHDELHSVARA